MTITERDRQARLAIRQARFMARQRRGLVSGNSLSARLGAARLDAVSRGGVITPAQQQIGSSVERGPA